MKFNTKLLHGNKMGDANTGATLTPVYQSSAFYSHLRNSTRNCFTIRQPDFRIRESTTRRFLPLRNA